MNEDFRLVESAPSVADYQRMRKAVGWEEVDDGTAELGLKNALYSISVMHRGRAIGCGRVVGDGAIYFYVQDIMVLPEFQGKDLGRRIMERVMDYIASHARHNSFVGLMAARGVSAYYERWGFRRRPEGKPGMFMYWKE